VDIIKGDYVAENSTMLYHAATTDSYGLFSGQQASIEANCLHGTLLDKPSMSKTRPHGNDAFCFREACQDDSIR